MPARSPTHSMQCATGQLLSTWSTDASSDMLGATAWLQEQHAVPADTLTEFLKVTPWVQGRPLPSSPHFTFKVTTRCSDEAAKNMHTLRVAINLPPVGGVLTVSNCLGLCYVMFRVTSRGASLNSFA